MMKQRKIKGVTLTVDSNENVLPVGKSVFGSLRVSEGLDCANFKEVDSLSSGQRKNFRLYHGRDFRVRFNTETQKYRISITIDPEESLWSVQAENAFLRCMTWLVERTNVPTS